MMESYDPYAPSEESREKVRQILAAHRAAEAGKASGDAVATPVALNSPAPAGHSRYHQYTSDQFGVFPPVEFAVDAVLPVQGVGVVYGPPQSGKSALVLSLVDALSYGKRWFDREAKQLGVWYCALEGQSGLRQRVEALETHTNAQLPKSAKFLFDALNLMSEDDVAALMARIRADGGANVLVIDTLACAMTGGDENSSRDMGRVVAAAKELQTLTGGLVLIVHHTGKDASRGMRGHSSLLAALDIAIHVQRFDDYRTWTLTKARDAEDGVTGAFVLDRVELAPDSKGKPRHSIVVTPIEMPQEKSDALSGPAHKNQRAALAAIKEYIVGESVLNGSETFQPLSREKAVELAKVCMDAGPKHQKLRAQEAVQGLIKQGYLIEQDDRLHLPEGAHGEVAPG